MVGGGWQRARGSIVDASRACAYRHNQPGASDFWLAPEESTPPLGGMLTFRLTFNGSVNRPFPGPFLGEEPTQTSYTVTTFNSSLRFTTCSIAYLYNGHAVHSPAISELVDYLF